jgi:arsenite-transporting ATPase
MRVVLLTGKGGVGKTCMALATALGAAAHGHRTIVVSTDPAHSLGDALGQPVGAAPVPIAPDLVAQEIGVLAELDRAWSDVQEWLRALLRDDADELVADELLVFPGMEELISLRAVREIESTGAYDTCVVDCAPTGATLRMLRFPDALRIFMENFFDLERRGARLIRPLAERVSRGLVPKEEFFEAFERLYREVEDVRQILLDGDRTSARLVVNPARVVVEEARRSFAYLSLYGVATDAVVVNRELPDGARGGFFERWAVRERREQADIAASFPVPILHAPLQPQEVRGLEALGELSRQVYGDADPAGVFTRARPVRLHKEGGVPVLEVDLPSASKEDIELSTLGDELMIRVRDARRLVALPASLAGRRVAGTRFEAGTLRIRFQ